MAGTTAKQKERHMSQRERLEHLEEQVEKQAALGLKLAKGLDLLNTSTNQRIDDLVIRSNSFGYVLSLIEKAFNARWSIQRWRAKRELMDLVRREGDVEVKLLNPEDVKGLAEDGAHVQSPEIHYEGEEGRDVHGPTPPLGDSPEEQELVGGSGMKETT